MTVLTRARRARFKYTVAMARTGDTDIWTKQPTQIDHACGHRFTHMMPPHGEGLLELLEVFASHPCPVCMSGLVDWSAVGRGDDHGDTSMGVC